MLVRPAMSARIISSAACPARYCYYLVVTIFWLVSMGAYHRKHGKRAMAAMMSFSAALIKTPLLS